MCTELPDRDIKPAVTSQFSSVQLLSVQLFATPWTAASQASLSFTISWSLLKLMSIELVMPSNHLVFCHPLLLPSIFTSIRVFSNESVIHIRWPEHWSFSFSISLSNEYSELISFRIDWFDLTVQGTLKSLLQYHSSIGLKLREILDVDPDFRMAEVEVAVIAVGAIMSEKWMAKKGVTTRGQGSQLM